VLRSALAVSLALSVSPMNARAEDPIPFEIGLSAREAGHVRALFERLSKENILYQFHLGDITKQRMQETASQIDRVLETLETGSPAYSIAPPVTQEIRDQVHVLDGHWGRLRRLALASPYDYLRYSSDLMPKRSRQGDPFSIRVFDDMAADAIREADALQSLIVAECKKTGYEFCDAASQSGFFNMHIQRIAKELVFVYAGIDVDENVAELRANRDRLDASLKALGSSPILTGAIAPSRGRSASFVGALWDSIQEGWARLRLEADVVIEGRVDGLDVRRMLKVQRELVDELDRLRAALSRYAEAKLEA